MERYPLSFPQQAIFLDSLLRGSATTKYNMGGAITIRGPLDAGLFGRALEYAARQHDVQRTRLHLAGDVAVQEFVSEPPGVLEVLDYSARLEPYRSAVEWLLEDIRRPIHLDEFPLYGDTLFRLAPGLHLWYPKFHHIVCDAFGHALIGATAAAAYNELLAHGRLPERERFSYADFVAEDREYAASQRFREDEAYWTAKFASLPEPLPFTARKGSLEGDALLRTERCTLGVPRLVYNAILRLCGEAGVTPFQFLLAVLFAYLHRVTGRTDIVIGTPILNRGNRVFRRTAGMFMNMMPLRLGIESESTLLGLARQIHAEVRSCYRHQRFPFGEIVRRCRTLEGFCHNVFDVTLVYRKLDYDFDFGGSPARTITLDTNAREETLSLEVDEYNEQEDVNFFFNFNPRLISAKEAGQMAKTFNALLADAAVVGDFPVRDIRLLADSGGARGTRRPGAGERTVLDHFRRQAGAAPDSPAVVAGGDRLSYGELDAASNRIAAFLGGQRALEKEQSVAVLSDRDGRWVAAALGIMKAGGAYLPLDPEAPRDRIEFILRDSGCRLLLTGGAHGSIAFDGVRSVPISEALDTPPESWTPVSPPGPRSLAYIIYTSGTTGQPKGVLVEHGGLANTAIEQMRGWGVTSQDHVLQFASPMFDASLAEVFLALVSGATLVIAPKDVVLSPPRFLELLSREKVTVATLPPAYLSALDRAELGPLRVLVTAGEAANPADAAHYSRRLQYINAYGPTETSICATWYSARAFSGEHVPIGKPLAHTEVLILDEKRELMPVGVAGEICIGGVNLARGYLNRPELTNERFIPNPFREGERLYRTGDLGRLLPDGNLEFLGRRDTQVKIRGYRVELGEIEALLKTHPAVETAAVVAGGAENGSLVACVVSRGEFRPAELRQHLAGRLPAYMVPSQWTPIPALPLNTSGKVDRDALLALSRPQDDYSPEKIAPRTDMERTIARIWEEVLETSPVGALDDFFELGGHSLKAVRVISRIQNRLGVRVELGDFFSRPTVEGLAAAIETSGGVREEAIPLAPPADTYPLSNAQARIWVHSQMEGGSIAYNMPLVIALEGDLDVRALEQAFRATIARHESLRTCFPTVDGTPRQQILPAREVPFQLDVEDLSQLDSPDEEARERIRAEIRTAFDFSHPPLVRARLLRMETQRWVLSLVVHHIVADGWSLDVLLKELALQYEDRAAELPPLPIQYKDYSQWMAQQLGSKKAKAERAFWMEKLAAPRPVLNLPTDRPRPAVIGFGGALERFTLPRTSAAPVTAFCAAHGTSPFMLLLAGVFGLLHRYTGDEDIVLGTPSANRGRMELENQIGLYLNTLGLRVQLSGEIALSELLDRTRSAVLEAQEHQSYPFDALIQDLHVKRRTDRNPLFDVMVVMQNAVKAAFDARGLKGTEYPLPGRVSIFDVTLHFTQEGANVRLDMEYNTDLFGHDRMERLAGHLDNLLAAMVTDPGARLCDVDILSPVERTKVLVEFAHGPRRVVSEKTVVDLFADQAARTPGQTAVVFGGRRLTYRALSEAASRIAGGVARAISVAPGDVVALVTGRSEWMAAGVIGIMASGAACLPIDAELPPERIRYLVEDSGAKAVVADSTAEVGTALPLVPIRPEGAAKPLVGRARPCDPAYVAYTSGSTGAPKASVIEHKSLANLMAALDDALYAGLPQPAKELLLTSIGFDVALKQIFGALTRGNTLVVADASLRYDPRALMAALVEEGIHLIDVTPAHFAALLAQGFARQRKPDLQAIVLGSEALPSGLVEAFGKEEANRHIRLYNFYGPSECTVETLFCRLDGADLGPGPIAPLGRPLSNTTAYVLSPDLKALPAGMPGEICLGGVPVASGYLHRPELTAAKFVEDPFRHGETIYRTGDLGRWRGNGVLEFLGRADNQLKIRGCRVEPGEVEHCLLEHPQVTGALAAGRTSPAGNLELVAWFTAAEPAPDTDSLRAHLRRSLPEYMIPARLVAVSAFPVLTNGKVDQNALPDPWAQPVAAPQTAAPQSQLEAEILAMWQRVLGVENPGTDASFFDVGGNSLLLVQLHSAVEQAHPGALKLVDLFSAPTVRDQARLIRERNPGPLPDGRGSDSTPLSRDRQGADRRIAIIGIGLRIGSSSDVESLWEELERGRDFVRPLPAERRREAERLAAALGLAPADLEEPEMAFLDETDKFDFAHFRMAPQKAALLDPREKLFLETAWHAIEDAGYGGARLRGTQTGVFLGESTGSADFSKVLEAAGVEDANQVLESLTPSIAASRISHLLDLKGPALLVDTACSSALSALCLAMDALRSGRCEMALAGAVKLHLLPFRRSGRAEIESADWRTHSFDDEATGTGGGEASIALLLKPLARALADGDPIHAILRGGAMNQDGASTGITAPNAEAQADVIDRAWKDAGIDPKALAFIEAHGTGTRLGDPVEVEGLTKAFRRYTRRKQFCALGSVKANIGHTDHAAGLAGILRAVLCLKHRRVAPAIHFRRPNRNIRFEESPLFVNSEPVPLEAGESPLLCGVSSFGLSGTNVHVVLEEAPRLDRGMALDGALIMPLSARTPELLREHAGRIRGHLERHPEVPPAAAAFTLATGRDHLGARAAIVFRSAAELAARLALLSEDLVSRPERGVFVGFHKAVPSSKPVLLEHEVTAETLAGYTAAAQGASLTELARLYALGAEIPWEPLFAPSKPFRCSLPGYPFERTRSWPEIRQPAFSLLGMLKAETPDTLVFETEWRSDSSWLLAEHSIDGTSVLAGSAYLELAQQVARRVWNTERLEIVRLALAAPLAVARGESLRVVVTVTRDKENLRLAIHSLSPSGGWQSHATAELARLSPDRQETLDLGKLRASCTEDVSIEGMEGGAIRVGAHWNCLPAVRRGGALSVAELAVPDAHAQDAAGFGLYPPVLDVALNFAAGRGAQLPLWFSGVRIFGRMPREAFVCARALESSGDLAQFEVILADPAGKVVVAAAEYATQAGRPEKRLRGFFHRTAWTVAPASVAGNAEAGALLIAPGCHCERDARLASAAGAAAIARSEREWRSWIGARDPGAELKIALLLPSCRGVGAVASGEIDAEIEATLGSLFALTKALADRRAGAKILVVGHLAHEVTGTEASLNPLHAAAAGFARVPPLETAACQCRFLDLDGAPAGDLIGRELRDAFASTGHLVAWRDGVRYLPHIEPLDLDSTADRGFQVREGATYLITGGTGGMGLEIARYLAGRARVTLVLAKRTMFPPRTLWDRLESAGGDPWLQGRIRALKSIESLGAALHLVTADAADRNQMEALRRQFPGIRGIFHCAGVGNDVFLKAHDWARLSSVLRPKIHGTAVLRDVFAGEPLDAFVLAGSLTAFTGAPGQAGYTAANAFQDAEACRLRRKGRPALSVAWTAWRETGMAAASGKVSDDDFRAIGATEALLCLDCALRKDLAHVMVGEAAPAPSAMPLAPSRTHAAASPAAETRAVLLGRPAGGYTSTERLLGRFWAEALGHTEIDIFANFDSLGGDSITAIGILERLVAETTSRPSLPDLLRHDTVESLAAFLDRQQFLQERSRADHRDHLVDLGGSGPRTLFCFPPGSGSCYRYYDLARRLSGWKVYGLNFFEAARPASAMADLLMETQPDGEFTLLGYSIGGNLAYDVALELEARGRTVQGLVFIDNWRRLELFHFTGDEYRKNAEEFLGAADPRYLAMTDREALLGRVLAYDRYMDSRLENQPLRCPIRLIQAESGEIESPFRITQEGWADLTADFRKLRGRGRHLEMLEEPHLAHNAVLVAELLEFTRVTV
ncbi:MAG: amino acid adenylation domain-containing protein [Bryobacteraceae bacterium]